MMRLSGLKEETDPFPISLLMILVGLLMGLAAMYQSPAWAESSATGPEGQAPPTFTLKECVIRGLIANPLIRQAQKEIDKAGEDVRIARSGFLPSLSVTGIIQTLATISADGPTEYEYLDQDNNSISMQAVQPLFAGFSTMNQHDKAKLAKTLSMAQKTQAELQLILDIQTAFLKRLKIEKAVQMYKASVERLSVSVKAADRFQSLGMIPYVALLQAKADLADAEQKLSQARNQIRIQQAQLNLLVGFSPEEEVDYQGVLEDLNYAYSPDLNDSLQKGLARRPELQAAEIMLAIAQKELKITKGNYYPRVNLEMTYINKDTAYAEPGVGIFGTPYDRDQENEYWVATVQMRWNIFEGGRSYYNYRKMRHEIDRLKERVIYMENIIRYQVRSSYLSLKEADERILSTRLALETSQEAYTRAKQFFRTETGSILMVLNAQDRLSRAEDNYNQALADFQVARANLYFAMGEKSDEL